MATESVAIIGLENTSPEPGRLRDALELAIGYSLILLVIWTPRPWQRVLYCVAAIFLVVVTWRSFESVRAMGLRTTNLLRSAWVVVVALLLAGVVLVLSAHLHTLHRGDGNQGVAAFLQVADALDVAPVGLVGVDVAEDVQGLEDPPVHRDGLAERGRVPVALQHGDHVVGPHGAGVYRGHDPQDVLPVPADLRGVDPAAGERAQRPVVGRGGDPPPFLVGRSARAGR